MSFHQPQPHNTNSSSNFFKVLMNNNFDEELRLPRNEFVRKHWEGLSLSNPIILLKLPNGNIQYEVHWTKQGDGNILLTQGWKKFSQISSMGYQYLVRFKYKGVGSSFEVIVYNKNASRVVEEPSLGSNEVENHHHHVNNAMDFFKVLSHSNFQEELLLPGSLIRENWEGMMSNPILLKLPNNIEFKVHWIESDNDAKIWLKNGWENFAQVCSLRQNYFLFFDYIGESCFEVVICDEKGEELDYSSLRCHDEEETSEENHQVTEILTSSGNDVEIDHNGEKVGELPKRKETDTRADRRSSRNISTNQETIPKEKSSEDNSCGNAFERALTFQSNLEKNIPSFIRDIRPSYVREDFVVIPNDFGRDHHLSALEGDSMIRVGEDMAWPVKLKLSRSIEYRATICSGWRPFCQNYALKVNDVCVFQMTQRRPLFFKIEIFRDQSCGAQNLQEEQNHDDDIPSETEGVGAQRKKLDNDQLSKRKRNKNNDDDGIPMTRLLKRADNKSNNGKVRTDEEATPTKKSVKDSDCSKAKERAEAYASKINNPYFIRYIEQSYVLHDLLVIPNPFAKVHLEGLEEADAIIRACDEDMSWPVKIKFSRSIRYYRVTMGCGWKPFCQKYELEVGDVCVFQMIQKRPLSFQVKIIRGSREQPCAGQQLQEEQNHDDDTSEIERIIIAQRRKLDYGHLRKRKKNNNDDEMRILPKRADSKRSVEDSECIKAKERAKAFASKINNPYFISDIQQSYLLSGFLVIQNWFSKAFLNGYKGMGSIGVWGEKAWAVRFGPFNGGRTTVISGGGWKSFCEEYGLQVGDVCVFQRTEVTPPSFQVEIFRATEEEEESYTNRHFQEDSGSYNMQDNQFQIQIHQSHLFKSTTVNIPAKFCKRHKEFLGEIVNLQVGEMLWPVKVLLNRGAFSEGWSEFARGCNLRLGDVCRFKIVDEESLMFKVSITRNRF